LSTLGIFRSVLVYLQGEAHPLYRAERLLAPAWLNRLEQNRGAGWLVILLFISVPLTYFFGSRLSVAITISRLLIPLLMVVGALISLAWIVPLAMFAGYAISRERAARTWDTLRIAPYNIEEILLAKAAASIRPVWGKVLTAALVITLIRMILVGILISVVVTQNNQSTLALLILPLTIILTIVVTVVEMIQEIALSVIVGILIGLYANSPRLMMGLGVVAGISIRVVQLIITLWLMVRLLPDTLYDITPYITSTSTLAGTTILLAAAPGLLTSGLMITFAIVREAVTRLLFQRMLLVSQDQ